MNLNQLFKVQQIVENNIIKTSGIDENVIGKENVFDTKFLALQVKLSEIANLTKCYKYAKTKENIPKDKFIIRYIDAMKFLLSIGNQYEFSIINKEALDSVEKEDNIIKLFSRIFDNIYQLKHSILQENYTSSLYIYIELFARFINLAHLSGLTFKEVYDYYLTQYCNGSSDFSKNTMM